MSKIARQAMDEVLDTISEMKRGIPKKYLNKKVLSRVSEGINVSDDEFKAIYYRYI